MAEGSIGSGGKYTVGVMSALFLRYRRMIQRSTARAIKPSGVPIDTPMMAGRDRWRLLLGSKDPLVEEVKSAGIIDTWTMVEVCPSASADV